MDLIRASCLAATLFAFPAAAQTPPVPIEKPVQGTATSDTPAEPMAILRGLDKITARITTFEAPIDKQVGFGTLLITVRACAKRPPEETPEVSAFLEVLERRPGETEMVNLFTGWMFASSPAISALEHPVYDVWVIDCTIVSGESSRPSQ
ncbi:MAG: DUF2155 domain-containing protein [Alphaproteobacteria bacterium]